MRPQPIAVALAQQGHAPGSEQDFEGIVGDQHPARHARREAVIDDGKGAAGVLFRIHMRHLLRNQRFPGRWIGLLPGHLIADHRRPYAAPVGQLGQCLPIRRRGGRDDIGVGRRR